MVTLLTDKEWIPVIGDPDDLDAGYLDGMLGINRNGRYVMKSSQVGDVRFDIDIKGKSRVYIQNRYTPGKWFRVDTKAYRRKSK